jgi:hypothetical protein
MSEEKALTVGEIETPDIRAAIALRLQGYTWRQVVDQLNENGVTGPKGGAVELSNLYKRCQPYLKMIQKDEGFRALKGMTLNVAMEAVAQVGQALVDGNIPHQSLPVVMGIAVDKYARLEAVEREPEQASNPILAMLATLTANGGTLKIEATQPKTVDAEVVG